MPAFLHPEGRMIRLSPALLALILIAGCNQPGFIETENVGPPPPLLPMQEIMAEESPQLDAEASAALASRAAALRDRAGLPPVQPVDTETDGQARVARPAPTG